MHINSLTLCPLTDGLIFKDRLDYSTTSPSTTSSSTSSSTEFSSRHPERKATAADKSNSPSDTCNSFSLEAAFDSRFDFDFDLKMNHQYHSPPGWKSTHRTHDDDSRSKASNSKVRGVSSSRRPQTPPASNISRPSSPGGNSFLSRQYEMMGKKTPTMLAASLRRPLFGKDGLRYGSDDDQRLEEDHVDDNYDDDDVDEYHHRSHSRPSGSRRGSLKEFFRRGSQELVHAADIIVAPKRDREAWITEENARLEKEFQMQLEKEKEKEKARLVVLPPPPPLPLKVKRNAAEPRHHRHPRAAGTIGPTTTTTTPPPPARPTPPPRSKGLTRGEDFAIFISRAVDPLKKKKNQGRSRKDSSDSLTCLDAVVVDDTPDEYARCDGCKMVNCSAARPLKYGLCENCWNVRFVKAPREGNWI